MPGLSFPIMPRSCRDSPPISDRVSLSSTISQHQLQFAPPSQYPARRYIRALFHESYLKHKPQTFPSPNLKLASDPLLALYSSPFVTPIVTSPRLPPHLSRPACIFTVRSRLSSLEDVWIACPIGWPTCLAQSHQLCHADSIVHRAIARTKIGTRHSISVQGNDLLCDGETKIGYYMAKEFGRLRQWHPMSGRGIQEKQNEVGIGSGGGSLTDLQDIVGDRKKIKHPDPLSYECMSLFK